MKILVTGANGQLGSDLVKELRKRKLECIAATRSDFDITDRRAVNDFIAKNSPDAVIHCAAYTAVDKAEDEPETCRLVNVAGTENIALACRSSGSKMLYISTDYVFPGIGERPYTPEDVTSPCNIYGRTKLEGECAVKELVPNYFIVRISWVFGANGKNFLKTMLRIGKEHDEVRVVDDQVGSPTYTRDLVPLLADMALSENYGIYHATNEGICSWAEFAEEIFRVSGMDTLVYHIPSSSYPTRARRPHNSRLDKDKLIQNGFRKLPSWQDAVTRCIKELEDKY